MATVSRVEQIAFWVHLPSPTITPRIMSIIVRNSEGETLRNKNGEVIGILNARQASANGVVFATKSKNIFQLVETLKEADKDINIKLRNTSSIKGINRSQQVKKVQDHVYMVKVVLG
jgi:hypothetical protein